MVNRGDEHGIIYKAFQAKDWATVEKHSESALTECDWSRHNYLNGVRFIIVARHGLNQPDKCLMALKKGLEVAQIKHENCDEILQHFVPNDVATCLKQKLLLPDVGPLTSKSAAQKLL